MPFSEAEAQQLHEICRRVMYHPELHGVNAHLVEHLSGGNFHVAVNLEGFCTCPSTPFPGEVYSLPCQCHITVFWARAPEDHTPPSIPDELRCRMESLVHDTFRSPLRFVISSAQWIFVAHMPHRILVNLDPGSRVVGGLVCLRGMLATQIPLCRQPASPGGYHLSFDRLVPARPL